MLVDLAFGQVLLSVMLHGSVCVCERERERERVREKERERERGGGGGEAGPRRTLCCVYLNTNN